ncbi:MAG: hypothetical protein WBD58_03215 [Geitlerinemataceae cyanobacterium]
MKAKTRCQQELGYLRVIGDSSWVSVELTLHSRHSINGQKCH